MIMHNKSDVDLEESEMIMPLEQFHGKSLAEHNDTFNMVLGTSNLDINLLHNGFIQPNIYELDESWAPKKS